MNKFTETANAMRAHLESVDEDWEFKSDEEKDVALEEQLAFDADIAKFGFAC